MLNKILSVTNKELNSINIPFKNIDNYFHFESGREHYRLLMYISTLFYKQTLYDIGTYTGLSALALSCNKNIRVKSYDIRKNSIKKKLNIKFIIGDVLKDGGLKYTPFILLDTEHDGIFENEFYNHLIKISYKGLLMLDDIFLNDEMREFYYQIKQEKYDLTYKGHFTGTGLINFK